MLFFSTTFIKWTFFENICSLCVMPIDLFQVWPLHIRVWKAISPKCLQRPKLPRIVFGKVFVMKAVKDFLMLWYLTTSPKASVMCKHQCDQIFLLKCVKGLSNIRSGLNFDRFHKTSYIFLSIVKGFPGFWTVTL